MLRVWEGNKMRIKEIVNAITGDGRRLLVDYILYRLGRKEKMVSSLNMEITWRCPLRCKHCYYWRNLGSLERQDGYSCRSELCVEELRKIFQRYKDNGASSVVLTGGEPGLRLDVIQAAWEIFGTGCVIITNGMISIPKHIKTRIFVSLDGGREVNKKIRGVDIFDQVLANIKDDDRVVLAPTLSKLNIGEIEELVAIARASGVKITFSG